MTAVLQILPNTKNYKFWL